MPVAVSILEFVLKEVGKQALWAAVNEYFPSDDTFDKKVLSNLDQLNRKIDSIGQDAAFLRIQPVKDDYITQINYLKKELIPSCASKGRKSRISKR